MKIKKLFSLFFIAALAFFMFSTAALTAGEGDDPAWGGGAAAGIMSVTGTVNEIFSGTEPQSVAGSVYFNGGSGTVDDPYKIATAAQLDQVRDHLDKHFVLTADINLEDYDNWEPIGAFQPTVDLETPDPTLAFTGTFDGNNKTISNLSIDQPTVWGVGLFGCVTGTPENPGSIYNLTVKDVDVTGYYCTGGVVGFQDVDSVLEGITMTGDNTIQGTAMTGGIAGVSFGNLSACEAAADIVILGNGGGLGGVLAGGMEGDSVINCSATGGTVTAEGDGCFGLGGLAGCFNEGVAITDCHADDVVIRVSGANNLMIGGLLGYTGTYGGDTPTSVTECTADVTIEVSGSTSRVGGLVGGSFYHEAYASEIPGPSSYAIGNCTTAGSITGGSEAIGSIAGYAYNSTVENCTSTMTINGNSNPPQVGWRAVAQTVTENNKELVITPGTQEEVIIEVPAGVTGATVNVAALLGAPAGGRVSATLPAMNITADIPSVSEAGPVEVSIPAGTVVSAPEGWDGTINAPALRSSASVTVTPDSGKEATVNTAIEIGFGDVPLTFDRAVRLLIPGQAGKDVGYSRGGVFTKITNHLNEDSQAAGDDLAADGDGWIDVGDDLVVWTKHFTQFITYSQTSRSSSGSGGGGSSAVRSTTGTATVTPSAGGTVSLGDEATVVIPADALQGTAKVEVKIQKVSQPPAAPAGFKLAGDVYEFSVGGVDTYRFAKNVTLKISFDPSSVSASMTPSLQYYDQTEGEWVEIGGSVSGNFVIASVDHFTKFAVMTAVKEAEEEKTQPSAVPAKAFNDIAGHWAFSHIKQLVALDAISGYADGSFRPDSSITRAEFATVLAKAFKLPPQSGKVFTDTENHWARDYISAVVAGGIASGYDDSRFGPDNLITREQMALMIGKASGLSPEAGETSFADSGSISQWAREAMAAAVENGIMTGYPDNTVRPQANATRAEAVTIIVKALD